MSYFKKLLTLFVLTLLPIIVLAQTCQTASVPVTTPTNRFIVNNNGTVSDTKTGLMWKQCTEGQAGADCGVGGATSYLWQSSLQQVQTVNNSGGFAGYSDWRIPNIKELLSIVEDQCVTPAINLMIFPNTPNDGVFWSSSPFAHDGNLKWYVYFGTGHSGNGYKYNYYNVRLVR